MENCIFCKIVSCEWSSMRVFEDNWTLAFMDLAKDADGHILVIPKDHCTNILDCNQELMSHVMNTVKKVSNHLVDKCGYEGVDLLCANNEAAGQTVNHFHVHIIPRKNDDGLGKKGEWPQFIGAKREIEEVFAEIKMNSMNVTL